MNSQIFLIISYNIIRKVILGGFLLFFFSFILVNNSNAQNSIVEWKEPIDLTQNGKGKYLGPRIICDSTQNLHIFWHSLGENASIFYMSDINGSFSLPNSILSVAYPINNRTVRIDISPKNNYFHLIWISNNKDLLYSQAQLSNAFDSRKWSSPRMLADGIDAANIKVAASGKIYIVLGKTESYGVNYSISIMKSVDNGANWLLESNVLEGISTENILVDACELELDNQGKFHVTYTIKSIIYGNYSLAEYITSNDGINWTVQKTINFDIYPGISHLTPFLFEPNEIHLTWHNPRRMHQWSLDGGNSWSEPIGINQLGAAFGGTNQLVKTSDGSLYSLTAIINGVFVSKFLGNRWGDPIVIDKRDFDPHAQHLTACRGNEIHIVYDERETFRIWYSSVNTDAPKIPRSQSKESEIDVLPELITTKEIEYKNPIYSNDKKDTLKDNLGIDQTKERTFSLSYSKQILVGIFPVIILISIIIIFRRNK